MKSILTLCLFITIPLFLSGQYSDLNRTLIEYSDLEMSEKMESEVTSRGGSILVKWPGGMWVRWKDGAADLSGLPLGVEKIQSYSSIGQWMDQVGDCVLEGIECDVEATERGTSRFQKGTSDSLTGHTICALFFVNQIQSSNPWTVSDQQQIMNNVGLNLAWWAEQALLYDEEISFEIQPYYFDHPYCHVTEDPTVSPGRGWAMEIMEQAGFGFGSLGQRQLEFTQNLINESQSDWGFIAYIIRGASHYRSNAQIFGPSTTVHYLAARTSLTFAHEVGHIFGLRDEYEERAFGTMAWELNELPNLNADYRNHINAPCIMKVSSLPVGLCCYNAVHLVWTQNVEMLHIQTEPEDALFEIEYLNTASGAVYQSRIHQGATSFPLGRGQHVRLYGLDTARVGGGVYTDPYWNVNSSPAVEYVADGTLSDLYLHYGKQESTHSFVEYWDVGQQIPSRKIWGLKGDGESGIFILSNQGVALYRDGEMIVFDKKTEIRPGEFRDDYRSGESANRVYHLDNTFIIAGSALSNRPNLLVIRDGEVDVEFEVPNSFREEGSYLSAVLLEDGSAVAAFSEGGLHVHQPDGRFDIIDISSGLPDNGVRVIDRDKDGNIILGYDGGRTGDGFSGLYVLQLDPVSVVPYDQVPQEIREDRISDIKFFEGRDIMAVITRDKIYENEGGEWKTHSLGGTTIFDADRIGENRWAVGSAVGLHYQNDRGEWIHRNVENYNFQENFVRSVLSLPGGVILAGHLNYGLTAYHSDQTTHSGPVVENSFPDIQLYPNPNSGGKVYFEPGKLRGEYELVIFDLLGRTVQSQPIAIESESPFGFSHALNPGMYLVHLKGAESGLLGIMKVVE